MTYQIIAILILVAFYTFYFAKIIIQKSSRLRQTKWGLK